MLSFVDHCNWGAHPLQDPRQCASVEQGNAIVVELILDKYSKQFKKDWKNYKKGA